jgi:hypothetical protein
MSEMRGGDGEKERCSCFISLWSTYRESEIYGEKIKLFQTNINKNAINIFYPYAKRRKVEEIFSIFSQIISGFVEKELRQGWETKKKGKK